MNSPQKKLKFNRSNFFTGIFLILILNIVGPQFVDPQVEGGWFFYFGMALVTSFMFPFLEVVDDESKS